MSQNREAAGLQPQQSVTHSDLHQGICVYLYNVFRGLLATMPSSVVLHDVGVAWDVQDLKPHCPDIAVIFGIRQPQNWSTFDVAEQGVRPALIVEVTSPETRRAHVGSQVQGIIMARRNSAVTCLRLCAHSKMATYWSKNHLLTPRNGRRKFRTPVQIPSIVVLWTSRMPSPSSARAHSRWPGVWQTVTWARPVAGKCV